MKIGIDLDDVLVQFLAALIKYHNDTYGTNLKFEQFHSYQFWKIWGGNKKEAIQKVYDFYESPYFENILPVDGAQKTIQFLSSKNYDLYIITSRPSDISKKTRESVQKHFPNCFKKIYFTNQYSKNTNPTKKKEICDSLNVDILIEDSVEYALDCLNDSRKVFLINQPWNIKKNTPEEIYRVDSWKEIIEKFKNKF